MASALLIKQGCRRFWVNEEIRVSKVLDEAIIRVLNGWVTGTIRISGLPWIKGIVRWAAKRKYEGITGLGSSSDKVVVGLGSTIKEGYRRFWGYRQNRGTAGLG